MKRLALVTLRALFAFLESPDALALLLLLIILLALQGCATTFDTQDAAVRELEQHAYKHRQFDRGDVPKAYTFTDDPHAECSKTVVLGKYIPAGKLESDGYRIRACAILPALPCRVILPYDATKLIVREEELHCRFGDFHRGK